MSLRNISKDLETNIDPLPPRLSIYRSIIRPLLFMFDSEKTHDFFIASLERIFKSPWARKKIQNNFSAKIIDRPTYVAGMKFRNEIGLAAGFDKNARLIDGIDTLGFGFVEIGTVTPRPQSGNERPRIFREKSRRALVNKMGFPNDGMDEIHARVSAAKDNCPIPIGVNIGKNKATPNSGAHVDYEELIKKFKDVADYFTVNISSPNTPGLRDLQNVAFLDEVAISINRQKISQPVFLKLSPDLNYEELRQICARCGPNQTFSGLVLTNTIPTDLGGISGYPLKKVSMQCLAKARSLLKPESPIISVGGIETPSDVRERMNAGASALQIYTSMIYQGPRIVRHLLKS